MEVCATHMKWSYDAQDASDLFHPTHGATVYAPSVHQKHWRRSEKAATIESCAGIRETGLIELSIVPTSVH